MLELEAVEPVGLTLMVLVLELEAVQPMALNRVLPVLELGVVAGSGLRLDWVVDSVGEWLGSELVGMSRGWDVVRSLVLVLAPSKRLSKRLAQRKSTLVVAHWLR